MINSCIVASEIPRYLVLNCPFYMRISFLSLEKSLAQLVLRRLRGKCRQDKGEQHIQSSQLQGHRGRSVPLLLPQTVITKSKKTEKDPPRTIYGLKGVLF